MKIANVVLAATLASGTFAAALPAQRGGRISTLAQDKGFWNWLAKLCRRKHGGNGNQWGNGGGPGGNFPDDDDEFPDNDGGSGFPDDGSGFPGDDGGTGFPDDGTGSPGGDGGSGFPDDGSGFPDDDAGSPGGDDDFPGDDGTGGDQDGDLGDDFPGFPGAITSDFPGSFPTAFPSLTLTGSDGIGGFPTGTGSGIAFPTGTGISLDPVTSDVSFDPTLSFDLGATSSDGLVAPTPIAPTSISEPEGSIGLPVVSEGSLITNVGAAPTAAPTRSFDNVKFTKA